MANKKEILTTIGIILGASALGFGIYWFGFRKKPMPGLGGSNSSSGGGGAASVPQASDEEYMAAFTHIANTEIEPKIREEYRALMKNLTYPSTQYNELNTAMWKEINRTRSLAANPELIKKLVNMANVQFKGNEKEGFKQLALKYAKNQLTL